MGGTDWNEGNSIAVDGIGNVYTTGRFKGTADFNPGAGTFWLTSAGGYDIFISKLDASGNFLWAKRMGGTNDDSGWSIIVDGSGNVYTTGYFTGMADFDPGAGTFWLTSAGYEIFISKLDASGNFIWAKKTDGTISDIGMYIAVDGSGNVYTTGSFDGTADFDPGAGTFNLTSAGNSDIFVLKLGCNTYSAQTATACDNYIWAQNGQTYTASGIYTDTIPNTAGCDSVMTLNLTINIVDTSVTASADSLTANAAGATYQWLNCNNNYVPIAGATNQTFTPPITGVFAVAVSENGCTDTSSCYYVIITGINGNSQNGNFSVYPNPTSGLFTIELAGGKNTSYQITDIIGKVILKGTLKNKRTILDLSAYEAGVYILKINGQMIKLIRE